MADRQPPLPLEAAATARPFLKWAGGKGRLLGQLEPLLPEAFARTFEVFLGGGALFFHLQNLGRLAQGAVLNDRNAELMNCYRVIQDAGRLEELMRRLDRHAEHAMDARTYYRVRARDREADFADRVGPVERAARTIFLNRTCYNGLYRLNRKGQFNVPYGKWTRPPRLYDAANLWACHRALQGVELRSDDFQECLADPGEGDFVYLDPPYHPTSVTASFTAYTGVAFGRADQQRLAEQFRQLDARGCLVLLTNSATPLVRRLYRGFRRDVVQAPRPICRDGGGRGAVEELAVRNY
ncbi:MAG: DNA adenine methylase [Candidatus Brocadiia bacterium]